MSESSASILERARLLYETGEQSYRDRLLEIGRLLHEYVLAFLREGDELSEELRLQRTISRDAAIVAAASGMKTTLVRVNHLIRATMVYQLVGKGVPLRSHWSMYRFSFFVVRKTGKRDGRDVGKHLPISLSETWEVKKEYAEIAPRLWKRAVVEDWNQDQTIRELLAAFKPNAYSRRKEMPRIPKRALPPLQSLSRVAKRASPGDVAEMCMAMILEAEDPKAVASILEGRLQEVKKRKVRIA